MRAEPVSGGMTEAAHLGGEVPGRVIGANHVHPGIVQLGQRRQQVRYARKQVSEEPPPSSATVTETALTP